MSTTARRRDVTRLDLTRAEQWVVHHVMLNEIERRRENDEAPPWWAIDVIEKLEDRPVPDGTGAPSGERSFTCYEAWRLRRALAAYADRSETPDRDVTLAVDVIHQLEETFVEPPAALR